MSTVVHAYNYVKTSLNATFNGFQNKMYFI